MSATYRGYHPASVSCKSGEQLVNPEIRPISFQDDHFYAIRKGRVDTSADYTRRQHGTTLTVLLLELRSFSRPPSTKRPQTRPVLMQPAQCARAKRSPGGAAVKITLLAETPASHDRITGCSRPSLWRRREGGRQFEPNLFLGHRFPVLA
jgi:hypothetical protein